MQIVTLELRGTYRVESRIQTGLSLMARPGSPALHVSGIEPFGTLSWDPQHTYSRVGHMHQLKCRPI